MKKVLKRWQRLLRTELDILSVVSASRIIHKASAPRCSRIAAAQVDSSLIRIMKQLSEQYPRYAVVAYGSRICGKSDDRSDLDVILIHPEKNCRLLHKRDCLDGVDIDIAIIGSRLLLKILIGRHKDNNNWFLQVFHNCYVYSDPRQETETIIAVCEKMLLDGAPKMRKEEVSSSRAFLLSMLRLAQLRCSRAELSPENAVLARMRCDQLVSKSIYLFFKVRGEWTTSFRRLLDKCATDHPEFYSLWLSYVESNDAKEAIDAAILIIDAVYKGQSTNFGAAQNYDTDFEELLD